jgi:hypothetical protein
MVQFNIVLDDELESGMMQFNDMPVIVHRLC